MCYPICHKLFLTQKFHSLVTDVSFINAVAEHSLIQINYRGQTSRQNLENKYRVDGEQVLSSVYFVTDHFISLNGSLKLNRVAGDIIPRDDPRKRWKESERSRKSRKRPS